MNKEIWIIANLKYGVATLINKLQVCDTMTRLDDWNSYWKERKFTSGETVDLVNPKYQNIWQLKCCFCQIFDWQTARAKLE